MSVILLTVYSIYKFRKENFKVNLYLLFPAGLFLLIALSALWSIDKPLTLKSIAKALTLFVVPLAFSINPPLSKGQVTKVLNIFTIAVTLFGIYILLRSGYTYFQTGDINVFFYHTLSGDINAIYLSAVFSMAFFHLLVNHSRKWNYLFSTGIIAVCILLLSSKTVIIVTAAFFLAYMVQELRKHKRTLVFLLLVVLSVGAALLLSKFKDRWEEEIAANTGKSVEYVNNNNVKGIIYDVNIKDAWNVENFGQDKRFTGTSFRVYQIRIFLEMLKSDNIFFSGYGFNASQQKIVDKGNEHNIFLGTDKMIGYQNMNFHNQYIQTFAELGIAGLIILLALLTFNLKKAFKNKYFVHIAFAILMITLFLTESFIWRQRGVVLFTVLYCMFNTVAMKEKEIL